MPRRRSTTTDGQGSHKKRKLSRADAILQSQDSDRNKKEKRATVVTPPAASAVVDISESPSEAKDYPCLAGINHRSKKVGSTRPFVLDDTIVFPSVRRLFVDQFKEQKKLKAISPDNLKKSAIHHFPSRVPAICMEGVSILWDRYIQCFMVV